MLQRLIAAAKTREHIFMVVVAIMIGCLGGFGAIGFRLLIHSIQRVGFGAFDVTVPLLRSHPAWWLILVPAVGGLFVGPLVHRFAREAKGHGVPEVIEAVALRSGVIRPRIVVVKALASALSIGTGGSVGREGPIVQIGAAIGSAVGQWLRVSGIRLRTLVGCGAAAGIAATFNAPIAGALFAVEVILGDFGVARFSPIVISSVVATVVSRHFLGDAPAFRVPAHQLGSPWELLIYMALGVVAAVVAVLFVRVLYGMEDLVARVKAPPWIITPLGGALVGVLGLGFPHVLGVGYDVMEGALRGELGLGLLAALILAKVLATSLTIAAGFSGGVFAPSLFIGAMTGGTIGALAHRMVPGIAASAGAYALVGMGAVVAGTTRAPITAILIIFELTSDYALILPLMASCIIAVLLAEQLKPESIYTMKLVRRGVDLRQGREVNVLRALRVKDEMTTDLETVHSDETFGRLLARITDSPHSYYYVVDDGRVLQGVVALAEISSHIPDAHVLSNLLLVRDIANDDVPAVTPEQNLHVVMRIFEGRNREELPVVEPGSGRLLGVISRRHLVEGYNRELLKRDMVAGIGDSLPAAGSAENVRLGDGFQLAEIDAPGEFVGRNLRDLDARRTHGVEVLLLRRPGGAGNQETLEIVPGADTLLERGDRLLVLGRDQALRRVRAL